MLARLIPSHFTKYKLVLSKGKRISCLLKNMEHTEYSIYRVEKGATEYGLVSVGIIKHFAHDCLQFLFRDDSG